VSERRAQLLDLAERVLERDGLERFGVNAVAREAAIRPPSLYKHFSGADDLEHALISRWFRRLALAFGEEAESDADPETALDSEPAPAATLIARFAEVYRANALAAPQLYRLATERPLDRSLLEEGVEAAAMTAVLDALGETAEDHDRARFIWAAAHGLVSLELAGRFPPEADLDGPWRMLVETAEA